VAHDSRRLPLRRSLRLNDVMTEVGACPLDASVAPRRVFLGHAHHELLHLLGNTGSATLTTLHTPVKLLGDQSLVATQEGVRRGDCGDLLEALVTERMGQCGEAAAFGIGQAQPTAVEAGFETRLSSCK
jgi:hypothetical protein